METEEEAVGALWEVEIDLSSDLQPPDLLEIRNRAVPGKTICSALRSLPMKYVWDVK